MNDKGRSIGKGILRYVIAIAAVIVLGGVFAFVSNYVSSHSKMFAKADYKDLNPLIEAGEALPTGEWSKLSIRGVVVVFAEEEKFYNTYGIKFSMGKSQYYLAVLDDLRAIAIQAADATEIVRLEKMSADFWDAEDIYTLSAQDFEGKIEKLSNQQLKGYYDELAEYLGFTASDSTVKIQYLILNTAAIPSQNTLLYVGVAALAVIAVLVLLRMRKKAKQETAQADAPWNAGQETAPAEADEAAAQADADPDAPADPGA